MSSFVIDKRSYVRVGALVAGIAQITRGTSREFAIYDYDKNQFMRGFDFVEKFVECYKLNVESVCKQYNDNPEIYKDEDDYDDDYVTYFKYGRLVVRDTMALMNVIWDITHFARSVNYQIEDTICNEVVMGFFNMVIAKLVALADFEDDRDQWGEFDLGLDKEKFLIKEG